MLGENEMERKAQPVSEARLLLEQKMKDEKWDYDDVAKKVGVSSKTVKRILSSESPRNINLATRQKFARALEDDDWLSVDHPDYELRFEVSDQETNKYATREELSGLQARVELIENGRSPAIANGAIDPVVGQSVPNLNSNVDDVSKKKVNHQTVDGHEGPRVSAQFDLRTELALSPTLMFFLRYQRWGYTVADIEVLLAFKYEQKIDDKKFKTLLSSNRLRVENGVARIISDDTRAHRIKGVSMVIIALACIVYFWYVAFYIKLPFLDVVIAVGTSLLVVRALLFLMERMSQARFVARDIAAKMVGP